MNELTVYGGLVDTVTVNNSKGTEVFERMLLSQYSNSTNLKAYIQAFIDELDLLMAQTEEVYLGRFIERAVGVQLDIIGIILDQERSVALPILFFGMTNAGVQEVTMADPSFADEATPSDGGLFKDESQEGFSVTPLDDVQYRRLLLAKAYVGSKPTMDINTAYFAISTLLGKTPRLLELRYTVVQVVDLYMSEEDTSAADISFIEYFSQYLVPLGTTFNVIRIP